MNQSCRVHLAAGFAICVSAPALAQTTLFDNGPYQTPDPPAACIPAGSHESLLQNSAPPAGQGLLVNGFGNQYAGGAGNTLEEDFTIPAPGWRIDSMTFVAYMSGNSQTAASPISAVYVRIWDGNPSNPASHIVYGNFTTNRLSTSVFSGSYRHAQTACGITRPLWSNTATIGASLPPGTYWVQWMTDGALGTTTGPFVPPVTIIGQPGKPGANAQQNGTPITDGSAPPAGVGIVPQDIPFLVTGIAQAPATGACCLPNGSCNVQNAVACAVAEGIYNGDNSTCGAVTCAQPGACCFADGTCQVLASFQCTNQDATIYRGNGSTCAAANCASNGACCLLDGTCAQQFEAACKSNNGLFRGLGSGCGPANCPSAYPYTGSSVFIPDATGQNGTFCGPQVVAEISVTDSFTIGNADVSMFVTHTFQGDLLFWLKHVQTGTTVQFLNRQPNGAGGFSADNFGGSPLPGSLFRAVDSAATFYRSPPAPTSGINNVHYQWKPENPFSAFAGENSAGQWQLIAQDCGGPGDVGNIEYWILSLHRPGGPTCYANCDGSTQLPFLNVADFTCFLQKFAANDSYANCDGSTQIPVLNVADFTCFLQKFAAGCSAP